MNDPYKEFRLESVMINQLRASIWAIAYNLDWNGAWALATARRQRDVGATES